MRHIPNLLTISRFFLALIFIFVEPQYRFGIICISLLTEFFDGALCRMFSWHSKLGALLDPIADKFFVFTITVVMFITSHLRWYELLLIGARDMVVFLGALKLVSEKNFKPFKNVKPRILGKVATVFQFLFLLKYFWDFTIQQELLWLTIIISLLAGYDYLVQLIKNNFYR